MSGEPRLFIHNCKSELYRFCASQKINMGVNPISCWGWSPKCPSLSSLHLCLKKNFTLEGIWLNAGILRTECGHGMREYHSSVYRLSLHCPLF